MIQKPEIQYVGQFYVYGSEAKEAARKSQKLKSLLPKPKLNQNRKLYVDPVALGGILVAVVILVVLAVGSFRLQSSLDQYNAMSRYYNQVLWENTQVEHTYRTSFDAEKVRTTAAAMGMIPASEAKVMRVRVTMPEPKHVPSTWENIQWFLKGLVAE